MLDRSTSDLYTALAAAGAVWTLVLLVRERESWRRPELDARTRSRTPAVAFFLVVPLGVLLHEVGHAVATWTVGGRVLELSWRGWWGYVVPRGPFTPSQTWWIAVSGNLVSTVFGLALLFAGYGLRRLRKPLRYLLLQAGVIEVVFALVVYPLMSLGSLDGDWSVIYRFSDTPALSALTAAVHAAVLVGLWAWNRGRLGETVSALRHGLEVP